MTVDYIIHILTVTKDTLEVYKKAKGEEKLRLAEKLRPLLLYVSKNLSEFSNKLKNLLNDLAIIFQVFTSRTSPRHSFTTFLSLCL